MPPRLRHLPILLLLALVTAGPAAAQDRGGVGGRVSDKRTGHALPFATVTIIGAQKGGLTDSEGRYLVTGVPPGTYEVRVQFLGYKPESRPGIVVAAGRTTTLDFVLEDIVVREEKTVEVTAERRLVEVRQGATVRSVNANEIRNLPVQTIGDVLQQQAGISVENDQVHVRGGRADETVFVVNGVANRDLVTGQSTAGTLNARSVAEVNVATGAYDVRYGNALSGVVEVNLREGGDKLAGGFTMSSGKYGLRQLQMVVGGPDPIWKPLLGLFGVRVPGTMSSIIDFSGSGYETRFPSMVTLPGEPRLVSGYEDALFGHKFNYGTFWAPSEDNRWSGRYGLTWHPNSRDRMNFNFSKRIDIDQGFSRTFVTASGSEGEPAYPWIWSRRIDHAPTILEDNNQLSMGWRRTLSTTGFTEFQFSRYWFAQHRDVLGKDWTLYEEPDDLGSFPDTTDARRDDYFLDTGDDEVWQDRRTLSYGLKWSIVQRLRRHEIEVGIDHDFQTVQYITIERPWVLDPDGLGDSHDLWRVHPWVGNIYVRDRLEYEGFSANIGLRADYWFAGREAEEALADTANHNVTPGTREDFFHDTKSFFGRRYKAHISPRIIVAHPITENSSFFFNYGQFTQIPSYRYVYSKLTSVSSETFPLLGNPNLNPEISINYEVGAKHQFLPMAAINATFFVKDVYDYPAATEVTRTEGTNIGPYFLYLNGHFARAKGFELELEKRRSAYWSGKIGYTFQQTKGKSSDPNQQKIVEESGGNADETRLSETFVRWNRPHKLTANFDLRFDQQTPKGMEFLRQAGLNLYVQGLSGKAYTPSILVNGSVEASGEEFSGNAPFQTTVDLRLNRWFRVGGHRLDLGLSATNIFDTQVIYRVDRITGQGRVWGVGEYAPAAFSDIEDPAERARIMANTKAGEVDDPSNYGTGAQWRLTLDYDF